MVAPLPMVWVSLDLIRGHVPQGGFGWYSLGQSQAAFGESTHAPVLIQIYGLLGESGVAFLVAITSGLVVVLLYRPWFRPRQGGGTRFSKTIAIGAAVWLAMLVGTVL